MKLVWLLLAVAACGGAGDKHVRAPPGEEPLALSDKPIAPDLESAVPNKGGVVVIYGASWCGPCHMAAAHLKERGVPFVLRDIEQDMQARLDMITRLRESGLPIDHVGIPVIDVGGQLLLGYNADALDEAVLGLKP